MNKFPEISMFSRVVSTLDMVIERCQNSYCSTFYKN